MSEETSIDPKNISGSPLVDVYGSAQSFAALDPPPVRQTMEAWERFVTGEPLVASALSKTLLASWQRSLRCGVEPRSRLAPMTAAGR